MENSSFEAKFLNRDKDALGMGRKWVGNDIICSSIPEMMVNYTGDEISRKQRSGLKFI